jgi:hypothetical protein
MTSPDKQISVTCTINEKGEAVYTVTRNGEVVILPSKLGVIMDTDDFSKALKLLSVSETKQVNFSYTMNHGKKKESIYSGNEQSYTLPILQEKKWISSFVFQTTVLLSGIFSLQQMTKRERSLKS